ncbi:MAG TPA: FG-GAP-like repeat-containing protein [Solirubrobacterales bacterium]|nr:FG-GAP-like repeat-containing protein [Solirubrobacterales bacterium]
MGFVKRRPHRLPILLLLGLGLVLVVPQSASAISLTPAPNSPFQVGNVPRVAVGDLNQDGNADLVTVNGSDGNVSVLLGDGDGGFAPGPSSPFSVGSGPGPVPIAVVIRDLNHDNIPDLAVVNRDQDSVSVLYGDGTGDFPVTTGPFGVGDFPVSIAAGDFNGDAHVDLVTANANDNNVSILLGDGSGGFGPPTNVSVGALSAPQSVTVAGLDGDTGVDIATANSGTDNITVLLNNGGGTFAPAPSSPFATGLGPMSVIAPDLNHDGRSDLATANQTDGDASVDFGNGSGGFFTATGSPYPVGAGPLAIAAGDLNGEGRPELATANTSDGNTTVLQPDPVVGYAPSPGSPFALGNAPASIAIADFDNDGKNDVAAANLNTADVVVLLNTTPKAITASPSALSLGVTEIGRVSAPQPVTVTVGSEPVQMTSATTTGADPGDFLVSGDGCTGQTLAAGASCQVFIRFAPSADGTRTARLVIRSDGPFGVDSVELSGTGTTPAAPAAPAATPSTTIDSGPPARSRRRTATFSFSSSEPGSSFECRLDAHAFAPCSSPITYNRLARRRHLFEVRATSPAGLTDPNPAQFSFRVLARRR